MTTVALSELGAELLETARAASSGRAAKTIHAGHEHDLRQTVIALASDRSLGEHEAPGEATLQVLVGSVDLRSSDQTWRLDAGDYLIVPAQRHDLHALEDAVVLLTVATRA
ncbi:cupin domain-containing protein [Aeromicrobium sp. CTD01-1L150]|uniref:cupin domain-containing protein n=1 Tax=Aeromicrobium sp. CTD01-1L150 TaxID=3341830 RepID=UPI0035BEC728